MKSSMLIAAGLVLALAACEAQSDTAAPSAQADDDAAILRTVARLECPERQGDLERDLISPDGRTCAYRGLNGSEVELSLIALEGRPAASVLTPMEETLKELVAPPDGRRQAGDTGVVLGVGSTEKETEVRLPGLAIDADGERASVRMPGLTIDARDGQARINLSGGKDGAMVVNADDGGAEIRTRKESAAGLRTSYILAQEQAGPSGWNAVGYEARGPLAGPLVVATVRARKNDDAFEEAKALLDRNVGS